MKRTLPAVFLLAAIWLRPAAASTEDYKVILWLDQGGLFAGLDARFHHDGKTGENLFSDIFSDGVVVFDASGSLSGTFQDDAQGVPTVDLAGLITDGGELCIGSLGSLSVTAVDVTSRGTPSVEFTFGGNEADRSCTLPDGSTLENIVNPVALTFAGMIVPEPGCGWLMAVSAGLVYVWRNRRN